MSEESEIVRIPLNFYRNNPEHEKVYAVLKKQKNKSAFIREAIWNYHLRGIDTQITKEDIRQLVREACEEVVEMILSRMEQKGNKPKMMGNQPEEQKSINFDRLKNLF